MPNERIQKAAAEIARSRANRARVSNPGEPAADERDSLGLLSEQEQRRLLMEAIDDYAIITLDPSGRVASWNEGARRVKGYDASEVMGRHFALFYPLEDIERGKAQAELTAAREAGRFEEEGWRMRKGGERFWARVTLTALRDAAGAVRGFAKVTRDLTERERARNASARVEALEAVLMDAELARAESEASRRRLAALVEGMSDGYFALDDDWRFAAANPSTSRLLGKAGRDLVGASFWDEVTDSVHSNFFKHLPTLLTGAREVQFEEHHQETGRWFAVRASREDGRIVVFLRDITTERGAR